ncbi:DUF2079 domain-containing protein [Rugosimonospora africana]|uniref:DUF2079 domain-containing protein n=1 Tax=Rugosimonospora africana TaxID=556532 RepID=UPI001943D7BF|nr:DUF2079 domain-containing protein [Rugosimonospora africana]
MAAPAVGVRRFPVGDRVGVAVIAGLAAVLYLALSFSQYHTFRTSTYDLVIFDQAERSYSRFGLPVAIVKGVHNGFGTAFSILGDHFSPILAVLAPLYWIHDGPQTLLVAQALLFASAVVPLFAFARRELGTRPAYLVAAGYALSWPVAQAVAFDFHEAAFAPVLTALLFERYSAFRHGRGRWWQVALAAVALLTVKEDVGLLVSAFGLCLLASAVRPVPRRRTQVLLGLAFAAGGLLAVAVTTRYVIPAFGGRSDYYWRYGQFGPTVPTAAWGIVTHPLDALRTFVQPEIKVRTLLWLLGMAALAPLASPYLVLALALLAERMLADQTSWWGLDFHYNAFLVIPLLAAGIDGVARIQRWCAGRAGVGRSGVGQSGVGRAGAGSRGGREARAEGTGSRIRAFVARRGGLVWACAVLAVALAAVPSFAFDRLLHGPAWQRDSAQRAAASAVAQVPPGVTVEAADTLGPQLSGRDTVLLWDRLPRWAPWVVADVHSHEFPFCDLPDQLDRVRYLKDNGYRVTYQRDGYLVLHLPDPPRRLSTAPSPGCP